MLSAPDAANFLISMECLGLSVDPEPLVEMLLPTVKKTQRITDSELSVLWYSRERHKRVPLSLRSPGELPETKEIKELITATGYKAKCWFDIDDQPFIMEVCAPKHRFRGAGSVSYIWAY